eukprot:scaffold158_cov388-Prasinococcus_capsulatus_cf.AAC.15
MGAPPPSKLLLQPSSVAPRSRWGVARFARRRTGASRRPICPPAPNAQKRHLHRHHHWRPSAEVSAQYAQIPAQSDRSADSRSRAGAYRTPAREAAQRTRVSHLTPVRTACRYCIFSHARRAPPSRKLAPRRVVGSVGGPESLLAARGPRRHRRAAPSAQGRALRRSPWSEIMARCNARRLGSAGIQWKLLSLEGNGMDIVWRSSLGLHDAPTLLP